MIGEQSMSDIDKENLTKDTLFKPNPSRMEAKNATTDKAAKAIMHFILFIRL